MAIKSVSVLINSSSNGNETAALQRGRWLANAHGAALNLLLMAAGRGTIAHAVTDRLWPLARDPEYRRGLVARALASREGTEFAADLVLDADLVVVPPGRAGVLAALRHGSAHRLVRHCACPVLVARQSISRHYRRILVAVSCAERARRLAETAAWLVPNGQVEVFHVQSVLTPGLLRRAWVSQDVVARSCREALHQARERIVDELARAGLGSRSVTTARLGHPVHEILGHLVASGGDLLVVGKRRAAAWSDVLCGSVALEVLGLADTDVLLVPDVPQARPATCPRPPPCVGRA